MSTTDIGAVAKGLATAAATITSPQLNALHYVPKTITHPMFCAGERTCEFDGAMHRGLDEWLIEGRLYAAPYDDPRTAAELLDKFLAPVGATSLKTAIEADKTLGGACGALRVERIKGYAVYTVGTAQYIGARLDIRVW